MRCTHKMAARYVLYIAVLCLAHVSADIRTDNNDDVEIPDSCAARGATSCDADATDDLSDLVVPTRECRDDEVTHGDLRRLLADDAILLVDVRERDEFAEDGRIEGAVNVPLDDVAAAFALPPAEFAARYGTDKMADAAPIVVHCRTGVRSLCALTTLREMGYATARHYPGGIVEWLQKESTHAAGA